MSLWSSCSLQAEEKVTVVNVYLALTDKLDWVNPEGNRPPVDLSKPLPLQEKEGRLIIPIEFFFNNNLEYLKTGNKERKYTVSMTKTKAARNTKMLSGIKDSHHRPSDAMHNPPYSLKNIKVILHIIHSDDGNPSSANIKQELWSVITEPKIFTKVVIPHSSVQDEAFQGGLFDGFQDEVKHEHVGPKVTRSQESERLQDDGKMVYG
ncbi:hypothetical protein Tco_0576538 [Tanacetum coccineum]